ncbi:hypothetical protein RP20_CCG018064 [Aedes albopictus]|nr:hypothetical protein RP20_CCG018064 [Aedes albopictus]
MSGTHGEVYQKQLSLVLLLRLTREGKNFHLAYELTPAEKFDDVVLYDRTAKQWTFLQSKHADGKDSKIDLNGLLPKTNREKGDFSLYKYFYSYMRIRNRFIGKTNFLLFTNKKLDEKLKSAEDSMAIEDQDVDEYLRFTSEGATHKLLIPTESTIQSILEYANKDLYSLKDAIKHLFTKGIITDQLIKYKVYLNDVLKESGNNQIRFADTFNQSLIFIAKLYNVLQPQLHKLKPINKPPELNFNEAGYDSSNWLSVGGPDLKHLGEAIEDLFCSGTVSDYLKEYEHFLALILTTTANGQLAIKETFNSDVVSKAELYRMLKAELSDMNKQVTTNQKLFDGKDSRIKPKLVLFHADASNVRQFFALLTLSVQQPDELESFIIEELNLWMRMWLRPDILGMLTENDYEKAVKDLDDYFESTLKRGQGNSKPYLDQQFVSQYFNKLQSTLVEKYPELKDMSQIYINRVLIFGEEGSNKTEHSLASQFDGTIKTKLKPNSRMTDRQFAANLRVEFAQYQCLVLTADPGLGKTKFLQYVALEHQKVESGAVFLFYLNRLQHSEHESPLDILKYALSIKNFEFIWNVLEKHQTYCTSHITLLFDGYDEIHKKNRKKMNNLLELLLKSEHIKIVMSVRSHEKKTLQQIFQKQFHVGYFSLEPFSSKHVTEYLSTYWEENVDFSLFSGIFHHSKFLMFSKYMIAKFNGLCSVPLMVKMMAKIYKCRFKLFKETKLSDIKGEICYLVREFSEVDHIYEIFIENCLLVKIVDACNGIGRVDPNKQIFDGFCLDHQLRAIKFLDIGELEFIFNNPKYNKKMDYMHDCHLNQLEKSILVKFVDGKFFFLHHSYAEYFVAKFLWDDFFYLKDVTKNVLSSFPGIRKFFIRIIENNISWFESKIAQETSFATEEVVFWACESNAENLLKYVLSKIPKYKVSDARMLHIAIYNGSDRICSYLIKNCKVHPDVEYDDGLVPLHSAVVYGRINIVQLLLRNGADINIKNAEGWSALHYAVHHKQIAITNILIVEGIDVNSLNNNKWNALHISCDNGDADMTKMLLQKGAQADLQTNEDKTPLDLAVTKGYTEVVDILIEYFIMKLNFHITFRVFQNADRNSHDYITQRLTRDFSELANGINFNEKSIHIAVQKGLKKKVKQLINGGANVYALNKSGHTALHLSASAGHHIVVELLLDSGANVNAVDEDNVTPLFLACQNGHRKVVETLIERGANVGALTHNKWTALHVSASEGHSVIAKLLLDQGSNVNAVNEDYVTPLYWACENGHKEVVETLIRSGANINALTNDNRTALHASASNGYCDIVDVLLENGAVSNTVDKNGHTPLSYALQNRHQDVVESLFFLQNK